MKCSLASKGCFAAIEVAMREVAVNRTDLTMQVIYELILDQLEMIRQLEELKLYIPKVE